MEKIDTSRDYAARFAATGAEQACKSLAYYATKKDNYFARDLLVRCIRLRGDVEQAMATIDTWLAEVQDLAYAEEQIKTQAIREKIEGARIVDVGMPKSDTP